MRYVLNVNIALRSFSLLFKLSSDYLLLLELLALLCSSCLKLVDGQVLRFVGSGVNHHSVLKSLLGLLKGLRSFNFFSLVFNLLLHESFYSAVASFAALYLLEDAFLDAFFVNLLLLGIIGFIFSISCELSVDDSKLADLIKGGVHRAFELGGG